MIVDEAESHLELDIDEQIKNSETNQEVQVYIAGATLDLCYPEMLVVSRPQPPPPPPPPGRESLDVPRPGKAEGGRRLTFQARFLRGIRLSSNQF